MRPRPPEAGSSDAGGGERLQKILAHAGVASRRAAEELIAAGRVSVNGKLITEMGVRADPRVDKIEVDGKPVSIAAAGAQPLELIYIALNKPQGIVSTVRDTHGRPTVIDLVQGREAAQGGHKEPDKPHDKRKGAASKSRLYPVGRLDADSTGLLLLTNDGDLTFRLTHPRYGVEKEYRVLVRGNPNEEALTAMREGVEIEGEMTAPARVERLGRRGGDTWLRVVIHEGRKRQVRLMSAAVGHPVVELQRVRFGPIVLGNLEPGKWRNLALHEVHALQRVVKLRK